MIHLRYVLFSLVYMEEIECYYLAHNIYRDENYVNCAL